MHVVISLRRSDCFQPSDQLARWDSHPLEIAYLHGPLSYWGYSRLSGLTGNTR